MSSASSSPRTPALIRRTILSENSGAVAAHAGARAAGKAHHHQGIAPQTPVRAHADITRIGEGGFQAVRPAPAWPLSLAQSASHKKQATSTILRALGPAEIGTGHHHGRRMVGSGRSFFVAGRGIRPAPGDFADHRSGIPRPVCRAIPNGFAQPAAAKSCPVWSRPEHRRASEPALTSRGRQRPCRRRRRLSNDPRRSPQLAFDLVVVAGGLLHGAVLGLLHRLNQRDPAPGRLS
jgi:hypothetical protein